MLEIDDGTPERDHEPGAVAREQIDRALTVDEFLRKRC